VVTTTKDLIVEYIKKHKDDFKEKYSIEKIGLFGSFATDNYTENSDIDIVYTTTSKGLTYKQELSLEDEFKNKFEKSIDLVNLKYMNPLIKRKALKDIIYV
jgi:predicted nucleotidyltransferase